MASPAEMAFRELVDDYRTRCLWYLRSDYYPATPADQDTSCWQSSGTARWPR